MIRFAVTGGRRFGRLGTMAERKAERLRLCAVLDAEVDTAQVVLLVVGDAPGADAMAIAWARARGVRWQCFRAEWDRYGHGAGPVRNQRILDDGRPDFLIAFPGGNGTADMVRRARLAGVRVVEVAR